VGLGAAIKGRVKEGRGWLVFMSLVGIAVGVVVFLWTDMPALALLYVIGAYAVAGHHHDRRGFLAAARRRRPRVVYSGRACLDPVRNRDVRQAGRRCARSARPDRRVRARQGIVELVVAIGWKRLFERDFKRAFENARAKLETAS
jgi:hypothetical protein